MLKLNIILLCSEGKSALANLKSENADLQAQLDPLNTKIKVINRPCSTLCPLGYNPLNKTIYDGFD